MEYETYPEEREIEMDLGTVSLNGNLSLPRNTKGLVLFAHGSGSSRFSLRNRYVAGAIGEAGIGTLLFDLLTPEEERIDRLTAELRFDIGLLARRVIDATGWVRAYRDTETLDIGYFGASTGAAAALAAAAELQDVGAVVSRGGRPDLVLEALPQVKAPTLLIVGGLDTAVIEFNRRAFLQLEGVKEMEIVPGATHLFEEPGTLEEVALLARKWFQRYLST
jgi:pimeloyl-ACP methyl ester carboxylesterase